jgi:hypothetical protein
MLWDMWPAASCFMVAFWLFSGCVLVVCSLLCLSCSYQCSLLWHRLWNICWNRMWNMLRDIWPAAGCFMVAFWLLSGCFQHVC